MEVTCAQPTNNWPDCEKTRMYMVRRFQLSVDTIIIFERDGIGSVILCEWSGHSI